MNLNKLKSETRSIVNNLRDGMGLKPLKALRRGDIKQKESCAVSQCLTTTRYSASVNGDTIVLDGVGSCAVNKILNKAKDCELISYVDGELTLTCPNTIAEFIGQFDAEAYPELIKRG
jgi:hypothetical protein